MKEYIRPSFEVVEFETTDIIQLSNGGIGNFIDGGENEVIWKIASPSK